MNTAVRTPNTQRSLEAYIAPIGNADKRVYYFHRDFRRGLLAGQAEAEGAALAP